MKSYLLIITVFFLIAVQTFAQIKRPVELDKNEKYCDSSQREGRFDRINLWVLDGSPKAVTKKGEVVRIYFPENFYIEGVNGNKYAKGYLENNTLENIEISRIDSTIDYVQEYFFINGKWIVAQENGKSECGNSYFKENLKSKNKIEFQLSISDLVYGDIKVPFKISVIVNGKIIESNVIEVNLYEAQIKNLLKS